WGLAAEHGLGTGGSRRTHRLLPPSPRGSSPTITRGMAADDRRDTDPYRFAGALGTPGLVRGRSPGADRAERRLRDRPSRMAADHRLRADAAGPQATAGRPHRRRHVRDAARRPPTRWR